MVVALVADYGISRSVNNSSTALSDLTLANLEALADGEIFTLKGEWILVCSFENGLPVINCHPGGCYICASPADFLEY
ncbi:NVEALA domain-containing protein [Capnocytophaga canis]|uniref:NVEALA domain-containing protein n=1 Tax=Capnocytophaga canis TaxID=1848903 RepID=UPI003B96C70E